jgi:hypothetical protein
VDALIQSAIVYGKTPLPEKGRGVLVIRSVSAKQRPRRVAVKKKPMRQGWMHK